MTRLQKFVASLTTPQNWNLIQLSMKMQERYGVELTDRLTDRDDVLECMRSITMIEWKNDPISLAFAHFDKIIEQMNIDAACVASN